MKSKIRIFLVATFTLFPGSQSLHAAVGDVDVFISEPRTLSTASYWIEGTDGVVLIDTQFLPKDGLCSLEAAKKNTADR
jgi:hypothetical protein